MSEEILKALMQLFAIIAKQDGGLGASEREFVESFLKQQLNEEAVQEYLALFDSFVGPAGEESNGKKLTAVKDSVRVLGICKKINKTLTQRQKVVVLVRLFELVNADRKFTEQRMAIINTVSEVFKLSAEEFTDIERFVVATDLESLDRSSILTIDSGSYQPLHGKHIATEALDNTPDPIGRSLLFTVRWAGGSLPERLGDTE